MVRFDDMIATVIDAAPAQGAGRRMVWRQLLDLLAQGRSSARGAEAYALLRELRDEAPPAERSALAASYATLPIPAELVRFFAEDRLAIAAPLLGRVPLPAADWLALLPQLSPGARSILRNRRDLPAAVVRGLASFGPGDLVVAAPEPAASEVPLADAPASIAVEDAPADVAALVDAPTAQRDEPEAGRLEVGRPDGGGTQIRDLLDRIESFRERRGGGPRPEPAAASAAIEGFSFETDAEGRIVWVEGVARAAIIGRTIAAPGGEHGVDGQAAGAFRRRAAFRNARLSVAGTGSAGGDWRISAVPVFDDSSGRFEGYRGTARRPRRDEVAGEDHAGTLLGASLAPDSLRQLVHELRTPINAIQGFADMIEGQVLGPAGSGYRERASDIATQARRLLGAVDDLDVAARVESDRLSDEPGTADGGQILCRLHAEQLPLARDGDIDLRVTVATGVPPLAMSPAAAERMVVRLIAATVAVAARGETVAIGYDRDRASPGTLRLAVLRPVALAGLAEGQLLDPGFSPGGDYPSAPALGLGFALRLVANLARAARARLVVEGDVFALLMPAAREAGTAERGNG